MNNIIKFIEEVSLYYPPIKQVSDEFFDDWKDEPEPLPLICLYSDIGDILFSDIDKIDFNICVIIFDIIEKGINSEDEYLSTAIATGLIEAMVNRSDEDENRWKQVEKFLGKESKEYAQAWKEWEPSNS